MPVRWGIIGCGNVTEVKSGPAFQKVDGSRLMAVMRRSGALAEEYARRHAVPRWYDRAADLIADPEVDAVYVATPPGSHGEYALQACTAGKPCYVEKPMARNASECRRMVDAFAAAGLPLFVAYYRRGLPRFIKTRDLVAEGRLGRITGVSYRLTQHPQRDYLRAPGLSDPPRLPWRLHAEQSGGGLFLDLGSHALDVLDFILGPLEDVSGAAANVASVYDVEDSVALRFRTRDGALGTASWNFAGAVGEDQIEITGTEGRVSLSTFGGEPVVLKTAAGQEEFDLPNPTHIQQPLIQSLVDELSGRGHCPSTGASAARTASVMDAALDSYYGGRSDAFWERPLTWPGRPSAGKPQ